MSLTGKDPRYMTFIAFRGMVERADRLRRWKLGLGPSEADKIALAAENL